MLNLADGFAARGYPVDLVLSLTDGPYLAQVPTSLSVVDLGASRTIASMPGLVRYLRREAPTVMLSALNRANLLAIWARFLSRAPTKIVVSERNTLSIDAENAPNWRARIMPALSTRFYSYADDIVAVSGGVADDLARVTGLPRERIRVLYNPVVTPALQEKLAAPLDHPWFAAGQPPVILAVGRLSEQKDFSTLIRAFKQVRDSRPARLLILGEGDRRAELEALVQSLQIAEDVSMPGWVENPYPYMKRASMFVLSSRWEGLPGVLIEALYAGIPLVATDCPSGPREVLADGEYGQLVPVADVNALAHAMGKVLAHPPARPPEESWLRFEMNRVIDQYIDVLLDDQPEKALLSAA